LTYTKTEKNFGEDQVNEVGLASKQSGGRGRRRRRMWSTRESSTNPSHFSLIKKQKTNSIAMHTGLDCCVSVMTMMSALAVILSLSLDSFLFYVL
jgi:biotin-(acetyl-CoA carboxylase) ligase